MPKPRIEVVEQLAAEALAAMEDSGIEGLSAAEVMSAAFTITRRITKIMITVEDPADRRHNIEAITAAIAELYSLVPPKTIH